MSGVIETKGWEIKQVQCYLWYQTIGRLLIEELEFSISLKNKILKLIVQLEQ